MLEILEKAGYVRKDENKYELTPRGSRSLGQKALREIYQRLKNQNLGNHAVPEEGRFGERIEDSKPYEFGDPFQLHMSRTIRNALDREGPGAPVQLKTEDFEIYRSELITQTATVLMVDLSWSMALRGSFQSAKKDEPSISVMRSMSGCPSSARRLCSRMSMSTPTTWPRPRISIIDA